MAFDAFDVVVVPFPFTDKLATKRRPALVISTAEFNRQHSQIVLAMITTASRSAWPSDLALHDWAKAGLLVPCLMRLKLFTLDQSLVERRLGALSAQDAKRVKACLSRAIV